MHKSKMTLFSIRDYIIPFEIITGVFFFFKSKLLFHMFVIRQTRIIPNDSQ